MVRSRGVIKMSLEMFRSKLASRASAIALLATVGTVSHAQSIQGCSDPLQVTSGTITGTHLCAVAQTVTGDVINDGTIGPPNDGSAGFLVSPEGIDGSFTNLRSIFGGGDYGGEGAPAGYEAETYILGALTIVSDVTGGVTNAGTISSEYGNGVQLGYGRDSDYYYRDYYNGASLSGDIVNSGLISSAGDDGVAAIYGTMSGRLINQATGIIRGRRGVHVASSFESWSGGIQNFGLVEGQESAIEIGDAYFHGKTDVAFSGGIENGAGGRILSREGASIFLRGASFAGGITNGGTITQELPEAYYGENVDHGVGILISVDSFAGGITNTGKIEGLAGPAIWITNGVSTFTDGIDNDGTIRSVEDGLLIKSGSFSGGIVNDGEIRGGDAHAGINVNVSAFSGGMTNTGTILGGYAGIVISAQEFLGDIINDGTISGGVTSEELGAWEDPGLTITVGSHTGNITNTGTLDASDDVLVLQITNLYGNVTNSGLIEATTLGNTAVDLNVGNGTTFTNTAGGLILGDVYFGGKYSSYAFVGEDGGVEGDLVGGMNPIDDVNDDSITVRDGVHYFISHGGVGTGSASNFASFAIEDDGVAIIGAQSIGSSGGDGYVLNNIGQLNLNTGGHLYIDDQSSLNVGSFTQSTGSTLSFFLREPPSANGVIGVDVGQINASGTVTLGGTLQAVFDPLSFSGTRITDYRYNDVIVSSQLITTDFASKQILGGSAFYRLEHDIDGKTVDLRLVRLPFSSASCSENGDRLGQLLEIIFLGGSLNAEQQALFTFLSSLPPEQVCDVFDDVGSTNQADLGAVVVETAGPWKSLVNDRLNGLGAVGCNLASSSGSCFNRFAANETGATQTMTDATPGQDPFDWLRTGTRRAGDTGTWGRMVGVWGGTDSKLGVGGVDFNLTGGILGVDHVFSPEVLAGAAIQYTTNDISFDGSTDDADIDSLEVGAYASLGDTRFYVNLNASFTWHDFEVQRNLLQGGAFSKYSGTTVSAYAETGKIFETETLRIQPLLALSIAHLETDPYREFGQALGLLDVRGAEFTTVKSMLGARLAMPIELESGRKVVPEARAVWAHEFADTSSSFTATLLNSPGSDPFVVQGRTYAKDTIVVGAGMTAPLSDEASVSLDYDASINPDIFTHTVSAGLRLKW